LVTIFKSKDKTFVVKEWDTVTCPFCKSSKYVEFEKFGRDNLYTYVKCKGCNLIYLNPRPLYDEEFINIAYEEYDTESYFYTSKGELNAAEQKIYLDHKLILEQMESCLGRKGTLLEIGCMTGLFLKAAKDSGWKVTGVDISKKMIEHIKNNLGIEAYAAQYETLAFRKKFDVIYCSHVIEHIPNPNEWFTKFKKDLAVDGLICVNIPNQYSFDRIIKRFIHKYVIDRRTWDNWRTPDHLYEPTISAMNYIIKEHGLRAIDYFTYSSKNVVPNKGFSCIYHRVFKLGSKLRYFIKM